MRKVVVYILLALCASAAIACVSLSSAISTNTPSALCSPCAPSPTCPVASMPPTCPPQPTCMPAPTCAPVGTLGVTDLAQDTRLAEAINAYRSQNGQRLLNLSYHLAYIAASRVQLTMIPGIDLGTAQIDPKTMPQNYAWSEYTFGGDSEFALSIDTPEEAVQDLIDRRGASSDLLNPNWRDIGASLFCNGRRCGYVVILGRPYP